MKTIDRRNFLKLTGAVGVGAALAGCGSSSDGDSATDAMSTEPLTGNATFTTWGGDQEVAAFKKIAEDFKAARGATVTVEVLPYDQIRTVVDRRLQAGTPPDLFRVSFTDVAGYASTGALANISEYLPEGYGDQFFAPLWSSVQNGGAPVGVPHHTDTSALAYNKAHFAKAGITDVPTTLETAWNWEQFVEVLQKLKAAKLNAAPFAFNYQLYGAYRLFNTIYQAGGTVLDDSLTKVTLDTPEARKALTWIRQLYTDGLHAPSVLVKRPTYPDDIFPTQKISMIQTGDFLIPYIDGLVGDKFEWGVTYLMRDVADATDLGGNAVVVTEKAQNKQVAAEFAKFLVTKENMASFCGAAMVLPVRNDLVDAELTWATRPDLMPVFQKQATTMPANLVAVSTSSAFPAVNQVLVDTMDQFLSKPKSDLDATIAALTAGIEKALRDA